MAELNTISIAKLSTATIPMDSMATLYPVPSGKNLFIDHLIIRSCASGMILSQKYNFGSMPSALDFMTGLSFTGLATTTYFQDVRISAGTVYPFIAGGNAFGVGVVSGATGVKGIAEIWGYLVQT